MIDSCNQKTDFETLRKSSRLSGRHFWMMFAPSSELVNPRVAFAIGRQFGNAVNRNRVRRQAKAILRELESDLPIGRFLVGAKPTSKTSNFVELREDLQSLIYRARQAL